MTYKDKREKVILGLKSCGSECCATGETCPYFAEEEEGCCEDRLHADAIALLLASEPIADATWEYYTNDEGKARWRCSGCGKICRRNPHDKTRCSNCGAHMRLEA